ncbi:Death-associated protein 1 [Myotis davidii]|uniref:Death-associated protein 1 n=1 Tax=Myotis davidii TaxID=225400 RepID=L5MIZ2_MYODS|nr:Death-associated protein 1 [Myotis davidii]
MQKHPHSGDTKEEKDKDEEEWETEPSPPKPTMYIASVIAQSNKDFPLVATQVAHQKPHASMDNYLSHRTQHIQQPHK